MEREAALAPNQTRRKGFAAGHDTHLSRLTRERTLLSRGKRKQIDWKKGERERFFQGCWEMIVQNGQRELESMGRCTGKRYT